MSTMVQEPQRADAVDASAPPLTRMIIAVLALGGVLLSVYMLMYKVGVIPTLACGDGGCDSVQNSPFAVFLGLPVPLWGMLGYGVILALAMAGVQPRFVDDRRIAWGLLATCAVAAGYTVYLNYLEAFVIRAWCRWCIGSAILVTGLFVLSLTEIPRLRGTK